MHIHRLTLENFRNLANTTLQFHPHINLISGQNGSGKTALLEALYTLGRGKSFRESQTRHIITHEQPYFRLIADIQHGEHTHKIGIERAPRDYTLRHNGETLTSLSKLAEILPIQVLNSDHFALIDQGPEHRRRFADYGLFFHKPNFLPAWQRYQHALRNRNAALRENWPDAHIRPYHPALAESAEHIDTLRREYLQHLETALNHYHAELGGLETIDIRYYRGWAEERDLAEILAHNLPRDRQLKHTRDGIHRAEWRLYANGQDVAHCFSRGQQKTLLCALILAQSQTIATDRGQHPVILIDDIGAELDAHRRELLMHFLLQSGSQLFITSIEADGIRTSESISFDISHGIIAAK